MLNFFFRFFKGILLFEFLDRFIKSSNLLELPTISKVELCFFISDISDLEDIKILNFFQFIEDYFNIKKFPFIKKILLVNRKNYRFCVVYTFRKTEAFDLFELFLSKINNVSKIERPSLLSFFFFQTRNLFCVNIKKFTFFDDMPFAEELPKISGNVNFYFVNLKVNVKKFLFFSGLNEDLELKKII